MIAVSKVSLKVMKNTGKWLSSALARPNLGIFAYLVPRKRSAWCPEVSAQLKTLLDYSIVGSMLFIVLRECFFLFTICALFSLARMEWGDSSRLSDPIDKRLIIRVGKASPISGLDALRSGSPPVKQAKYRY